MHTRQHTTVTMSSPNVAAGADALASLQFTDDSKILADAEYVFLTEEEREERERAWREAAQREGKEVVVARALT